MFSIFKFSISYHFFLNQDYILIDPGPERLAPKDVHRHLTYVWPWWSHGSWGSLSEKGQERVDAGALPDSWAAGVTGALG